MSRKTPERATATYWVWQVRAAELPPSAGSLHRTIRATSAVAAKRIVARSAGVPAECLGATRLSN